MSLAKQIADLYKRVHEREKDWEKTNSAFGWKSMGNMYWERKESIKVTPELENSLRKMGYIIQLLPCSIPVENEEQGKDIRNMSISEITKAAAEAGMTYGRYVQTYGR